MFKIGLKTRSTSKVFKIAVALIVVYKLIMQDFIGYLGYLLDFGTNVVPEHFVGLAYMIFNILIILDYIDLRIKAKDAINDKSK